MTSNSARTTKLVHGLAVAQATVSMVSLIALSFPAAAFATALPTSNLVVKKVLVGAPESVHYADFSFTYDKQGATPPVTQQFEADGQNDLSVATGAYDVSEVNPGPTYTVTYSSNQQGHADDCNNLSAGNDQNVDQHGPVICTITNTYVAPEEPQTCDFVSDATTMVGDSPAVPTFVHPNWTHGLDTSGAQWIWNAAFATPSNDTDEVVTFTKTFNVVGTPSAVSLDLAADNYYTVAVNGTPACTNGADLDNFSAVEPTCDITSLVHTGVNTLTFTVTNAKGYGTDPQLNPGGLDYHVHITDAACAAVPPPAPTPAHLTIVKHIEGGEASAEDFTMHVKAQGSETDAATGAGSEEGTTYDIAAANGGTQYLVSEDGGPANYTATYSESCQGGTITLTPGEETTCTVTNTYTAPKACTIVSDTQTQEGGNNASLVSTLSSFWTAVIADASWIWGEDPITPPTQKTETFTRTFTLDSIPGSAHIDIAADDGYIVKVNGTTVGGDDGTENVNFTTGGQDTYPVTNLTAGVNTIEVQATNIDWHDGGANPAGILYKLTVDGSNCISGDDNGGDGDKTGTLTIVKHTDNGDGTFTFDITNHEPVAVTTGTNESPSGEGIAEVALNGGWYNVTEEDQSGWTFSGVNCVYDEEEVGNPITNGEAVYIIPGENVTCTFDNSKTPGHHGTPQTFSGSNGGGGGGSDNGKVLGESTSTPPTCAPLLTNFLKMGWKNDSDQVKKLQQFLGDQLGINLPVTGFFGPQTFAAVKQFQKGEWQNVLKPWIGIPGSGISGENTPTGFVYQTTKWRINNIWCAGSEAFPDALN